MGPMPDLILGPDCWVITSLGRRPVVRAAPAPDPDCLCPFCFDFLPTIHVPVLPACLRGVGVYIAPPPGAPAGPLLPAHAGAPEPAPAPPPAPPPEVLPSVSWFWFGPEPAPAPRPRRAPRLRAGRARRR